MSEEDTFRRLQRMPYIQLEKIWQEHPSFKGPWDKHKVYEGWTWFEFAYEHDRLAAIHRAEVIHLTSLK